MEEKTLIQQVCEVLSQQRDLHEKLAIKAAKYIKYHLHPYKVEFEENLMNYVDAHPKFLYADKELSDFTKQFVDTIRVSYVTVHYPDNVQECVKNRIQKFRALRVLDFVAFKLDSEYYSPISVDVLIPFSSFDAWEEQDAPDHILTTSEIQLGEEID